MTRATRYVPCVYILSSYTTRMGEEMYTGNGSVSCRRGGWEFLVYYYFWADGGEGIGEGPMPHSEKLRKNMLNSLSKPAWGEKNLKKNCPVISHLCFINCIMFY